MNSFTLHSIAGFCNEKALWKLLLDLSTELLDDPSKSIKAITPEMVIIEGDCFHLNYEETENPSTEFYPPEGVQNPRSEGLVWSLGALVCYVSSGHYVFGGRGGAYQRSHPKVDLPTLKKDHSALTALVKRCLCYTPSQRISLKELHGVVVNGFDLNVQMRRIKMANKQARKMVSSDIADDIWPDKMSN